MIDKPHVIKIKERNDAPNRAPDFKVKGSFEAVREDCELDYAALLMWHYVALEVSNDLWQVWQLEKGGAA